MSEDAHELDFMARFQLNASNAPERVAFQNITKSGRETISYGQVDKEIRLLSRYLQAREIGPGSAVGLLIENHPRWGIAFLAAQSAGAVVVPLDILHTPETLARLIAHAGCRFLFVSARLLDTLGQIQQLLPEPLPVLLLGDSSAGYPDWESALDSDPSGVSLPLVARNLDDPHVILYTSGTTGDPKGVVLTGRNLYRNVAEALKGIEIRESDHFLGVLPLYHILALIVNFIVPLYRGAQSTFLDALDAPTVLKTFREERITVFVCVPQFFYLLHRRILGAVNGAPWIRRFVFRHMLGLSGFLVRRLGIRIGKLFFKPIHRQFGSQFRLFGVGGARFDPDVAFFLNSLGFALIQAYGMTETAALATITPVRPKGIGSVGLPLPHVQIEIVDPDEHGIGQVLIRGENVMKEYYRNPPATREAIDQRRWLHTGDLGYRDKRGFLYITGRAKEVIVLSSGKNIYPEEIEHFYQASCSLIKEMCVTGRDDPPVGERLHAVVVPDFDELRKQGVVNAYPMIRYLMENASGQLPPYKRVRSFEIWQNPLPRTTTRKIKRFEVEERLSSGGVSSAEAKPEEWKPSGEVEVLLLRLLQQVRTVPAVHPEMNLELDLGFDSLERVELVSTVQEALRLELSDEETSGLFTFGDLIRLVESRLADESRGTAEVRTWAQILQDAPTVEFAGPALQLLERRPLLEPLMILVARTMRLAARLLFRLKWEGLEHLPLGYPFLICPNHLSFLDSFLVACLLPNRVVRRFFALGYSDYFNSGLTGFLGRLVRTLPVNANRDLKLTLQLAAEGLRRGLILLIFPEGERSIDGTLKTFRKGPAILATEAGVPVVPVGIRGSYEVWARGSNRIRLRPIAVRFGSPIEPAPGESADDFNARLREAVAQLISHESSPP